MSVLKKIAIPCLAVLCGVVAGQNRGGPFQLPKEGPATTRPDVPTVGLYVHAEEATAGESFPIVVELRNVTDQDMTVRGGLYSDVLTVRNGQVEPLDLPQNKPSETSGIVSLILHATVPYPPRGGELPRPIGGRQFRLVTGDLSPEVTLEKGKTLLNHIDLPPGYFLPGDNAIELTAVTHGKTIATSGVIRIHCAEAVPRN